MSGQNPRGPGSRRRIAGERRPGREQPASRTSPPPPPRTRATTTRSRKSAPAPSPSAPSRRRGLGGGPSWRRVAVLGVVVLVLVALTAYLGLVKWDIRDVRQADRVEQASRTAPSVAERAAATILSYNYKSLDADRAAAERYLTPKFRKEYAKSMRLVAKNAPKLHAKVDAEVKASGVSHADPGRADVLVYVDQTTTSTANGGEPQLALNRALFRMKKVDGSWLVDDIRSY